MTFPCVLHQNKRRAHKKNWMEIKIRARNVLFRKWLMNIISYFQIIYLDSTCEWNEITRNPIIHSTKSNWISFKLQKGESFLWCPHIFFLYLFYLFWTNGAQQKKGININFPIFFSFRAMRLFIHCLQFKCFKYRSPAKHLIASKTISTSFT